MDKTELLAGIRSFLIKANKAGYAAGDAAQKRKEADGSETIWYEDGDWEFHDNFFGGEPYGGREIVKYKGRAVWIMVYYGRVIEGSDSKVIYPLLQQALQQVPGEAPYRGPRVYHPDRQAESTSESSMTYENKWKGDIDLFEGEENISTNLGRTQVYSAKYLGGLVDQ